MKTDDKNILWAPDDDLIQDSNLTHFIEWLEAKTGNAFNDYQSIWKWSIENIDSFWENLLTYFKVEYDGSYSTVTNGSMPYVRWFDGIQLSYAEHIFKNRTDAHPALIAVTEDQDITRISWKELEKKVSLFQRYLINQGVGEGDRVVGYLPNIPESIIAFLAVNSLGAIWSCCSPDFGSNTVVERFSQIEPSILITISGYRYNGKYFDRSEEVIDIINQLPSVNRVVLISTDEISGVKKTDLWNNLMESSEDLIKMIFHRVPFSHPIWILYSSGTTGKPKAITHSHGGVLLEHLKYLSLQNDVKKGENFFWYTTTGWMMWNFLQASMLVGGVPVLYDGSPGFPDLNSLWALTSKLPIHHFGTSAPFLVACMKRGLSPGNQYDFSQLRSIGSTGSPLPSEAFEWVYSDLGSNIWLCSMSGGTDVCTAFVGSNPFDPVRIGRIQCRALGCSLSSLNEEGKEIYNSLGEMVIDKPMPSMPIYFWNDPDQKRYLDSYFKEYSGKWRHGDWIEIGENGSLVIHGRSDATLNRKGVRIGTAEIYSILDQMDEITDALILNLEKKSGDDFMPLFVKLKKDTSFDSELQRRINTTLRSKGSFRHVPDEIFEVPDIPYTLSGKKMEVPVKKIFMGITNNENFKKDAVKNPSAMVHFITISEEFINKFLN